MLFVTQCGQTDTVFRADTEETSVMVSSVLGLTWALELLGCLCFLGISIRMVDVHFPSTRAE